MKAPPQGQWSSADSAYGAFAYAYDQALGANFFNAVRGVLEDVIVRYPAASRTHLDLACGTGYAVEFFQRHGYRSIGCDASPSMLAVARKRAGRLVTADFRALPFRGVQSRITCLYDSLNHMQAAPDLTAVFSSVREVMGTESLFFFDMNHPDIYPAVWGMREPFVSRGADHYLEIATRFAARKQRGYARVTGWALLANGERVSISETHEQRAWSADEIDRCLLDAGLEPVEVIDFDPFEEIENVDAGGVKLFYVCRKLSKY